MKIKIKHIAALALTVGSLTIQTKSIAADTAVT